MNLTDIMARALSHVYCNIQIMNSEKLCGYGGEIVGEETWKILEFSALFEVETCNLFVGGTGTGISSSKAPTKSTFLMDSSASFREETAAGCWWEPESTAENEFPGDPSWYSACPSVSSLLRQASKS